MEKEFIDYYKVLGVDKKASFEEIREAYNRQLREYRALAKQKLSRKQLDENHKRFIILMEAYRTLRENYSRGLYDIELNKYNWYHRNDNQPTNTRYSYAEYLKRREKERRRQSSIFTKAKKDYLEVREDEKRDPFYKRHERLTKRMNESFANLRTSVPKAMVYHTLSGTLHVLSETIYQIKKLKYITEDSVPKFIIRNRKLIGAAVLCTAIATSGGLNKDDNIPQYDDTLVAVQEVIEESPFEEDRIIDDHITLYRTYEIVVGDTLSKLSKMTGTPISEIKEMNGLTSDLIIAGKYLRLPYTVDYEDINYYTLVVNTNGRTPQEIAREYNTDIETLISLNREAFEKIGENSYIIISDKIMVPNFISKSTLKEKKEMYSQFGL